MRNYLRRVLELARPYRTRLVLGLLCGALSGVLAPTLALSLKLAVDAVFPQERALSKGTQDAGSRTTALTKTGDVTGKDGVDQIDTKQLARSKKDPGQGF